MDGLTKGGIGEHLVELVVALVEDSDLKQDRDGVWWADDWGRTVALKDTQLAILNRVFPNGRR